MGIAIQHRLKKEEQDEQPKGSQGSDCSNRFRCNARRTRGTGTQLRIAASGPGAQRVIGLTDQTDNFYTIANTLGLASTSDDQKSLSNDAKTEVKLTDGKYVAESTGFNGDAVLSYELKDKSGNVLAASDSSTPVSGVRVKTAKISR